MLNSIIPKIVFCTQIIALGSLGAHADNPGEGEDNLSQDKVASPLSRESIEEVVVTAQQVALLTEMKAETEQLLSIAGAGMDPLSSLLSLPGVTFTSDYSSEPAVRGSAPDDNGYYVDFIPARYVFHVFGNSIFNQNLIHSFDLYPAAFGSQYSDATGAVIDVKLRDPRAGPMTTTFDASFLGAGILLESGVGDSQAFYLSYRRSLFDQFVRNPEEYDDESGVRVEQMPVAEDYQFKHRWEIDPRNRLTLLAAGAKDTVEAIFRQSSSLVQRDPDFAGPAAVVTRFDSQGIAWERLSDDGDQALNLSFTVTTDRDDARYGTGQFMDKQTKRRMLRGQWDLNLDDDHELTVGAWIESTDFDLALNAKIPACSSFDAVCSTLGVPLIQLDDKYQMNSHAVFVEDVWRLHPRLSLRAGLHYLQDDYIDQAAVDPRLRMDWRANDKWRFHLGYGHYAQLPRAEELAPVMGNPDLGFIESVHSVVGAERKFAKQWSWSVELYHKTLENLPLSLSPQRDADFAARYSNDASGRAYGMELLLKKDLTDKFYGWLALSLSQTERRNDRTGESWRFDYDKPVILNWVMNYRASERWMLGMKWSVQSGSVYTPVVGAQESSTHPGVMETVYGELNSERLPTYHRLDLRAEYKRHTGYGMWSTFLDLLNVYDAHNIQGVSSTPDQINGDLRLTRAEGLGFFPSIGFKVQF